MFVKTRHNDDEFVVFDFLKKNHKPGTGSHQALRCGERGIPTAKKVDIQTKLMPLMPPTRHQFWKSLKTSDTEVDLVDEY